jgi:hypothetical protein
MIQPGYISVFKPLPNGLGAFSMDQFGYLCEEFMAVINKLYLPYSTYSKIGWKGIQIIGYEQGGLPHKQQSKK